VCAGCSSAAPDDERYAEADQALAASGTELEGSGHCATVAQVPQDCPADITWRNHGQYVSCVAKNLSARVAAGDITEDEKSALVVVAAQSDVGHHAHPAQDADAGEPDFKGAITDECP
jgi:hypothetical protein